MVGVGNSGRSTLLRDKLDAATKTTETERRSEPERRELNDMNTETEPPQETASSIDPTGLVARLRDHHITVKTDSDAIALMEEAADVIERQSSKIEAMDAVWFAISPSQRDSLIEKISTRHREHLDRLNAIIGDWQIETYNEVNLLVP